MANTPAINPDRAPAQAKLYAVGIEAICDMIREPLTLTEIAATVGVSKSALIQWLSIPDHSARSIEARRQTAQYWDEQAVAELRNAQNQHDFQIAREIAHHYRWRCSKIAPEYRDQPVQVGVGITVNVNRAIGKDDADHIVSCNVETGQDESGVS